MNAPFLLSASSTDSWAATHAWRGAKTDGSSKPDLEYLKQHYGHHLVQVANTSKRSFNEFERYEGPLREIIESWEKGSGEGLYVKDWHQVLEIEESGGKQDDVYETPSIFQGELI